MRVPAADDQPPAARIAPDLGQHPGQLIGAIAGIAAIGQPGRTEVAPLVAVDRAEIAVLVRPFVPDADAVFLQVAHVGVAADEPQQLVNDRGQMQPLGRHQRKARREIKAHLVAEHAQRAGARAILLGHAGVADVAQQIQVLAHAR